MIKSGMMIADRYEVLEKIGAGGMSDVYRGFDHKLNRNVAVKVLKQEFSENTDFVSKFRVEAQAAAGLMHPNIVNVYDVGEENSSHYIVMELVEGITLKKYIEKKARLSVKEAVSIAIQVSMGIEAAHNNHIIHRDIKPQNIIISKEGKVKVTDFGIAKAATSNTITSNVMGSVHYTSPEQVRGGFSDEKSDIYSLGITLFEMVTGRVPFNGETTVAVAIKHIQEPMPSPRDYVPEIPISVEQIILKATQKSPDRRYQNVQELVEDLKKSLISPDENFVKIDDEEPGGVTKNITKRDLEVIKKVSRGSYDEKFNTNNLSKLEKHTGDIEDDIEESYQEESYQEEGYAEETYEEYPEEYEEEYIEEQDPYEEYPQEPLPRKNREGKQTAGASGKSNEGKNTAKSAAKTAAKKNSSSSKGQGTAKTDTVKHSTKPETAKRSDTKNSSVSTNAKKKKKKSAEEEYDPKMEFVTNVLIVIVAVVIGIIFLCVIAKYVGFDFGAGQENNQNPSAVVVQETVMPDVVGRDVSTATELLTKAGLITSLEYMESDTVVVDQVMKASVETGTKIAEGSTVILTVSSGVNGIEIPSVEGSSRAEATATLEKEGFKVNVTKQTSDTVEKDLVISQNPAAGSKLPRGGSIEIVVSSGVESKPVVVPSILNMEEAAAIATLEDNGLSGVKVEDEFSDTVEAGLVTYQNYQAGITVNTGTEVEFRVSKGPEPVYYKCETQVQAPSDYVGGDATVVLYGNDGSQLFSTVTSVFPVDISVSNIWMVPSGSISITYNVNQQQEVTDAEGNVTVQTVQVQTTSQPLEVNFTKVVQ